MKRKTALFSLHHVLDLEWMREAYRLTRKDGAPGIDGVTAAEYEATLDSNLADLLERIKSGRYQALPVLRAYIPKADGSRRPLGIPAFEGKSGATGDRDGAGADLGDGLSVLLLWLPTKPIGTSSASRAPRQGDDPTPALGHRSRHPPIFRDD